MTPEQKAKSYEAHKRYRDKNRARLNALNKARRDKNIEAHRQQKKEWRVRNLEDRLAIEREYRDKNRDKINIYMNERRRVIKQQCLDYLGGPICSLCGLTSKWGVVFDFHHCNGEKDFSICKKISDGKDFESVEKELDKCVVLCRNCHTIVTSNIWKEIPDFPEDLKNKIIALNNRSHKTLPKNSENPLDSTPQP